MLRGITYYNWIGIVITVLLIVSSFVHLFKKSISTKGPVSMLIQKQGKAVSWFISWPDIIILFLCLYLIHIYGSAYFSCLFSETFTFTLAITLAVEYLCILVLYRLYQKTVLTEELRIPLGTEETDTKHDLKLAVSYFFILIAIIVMLNSIWSLGLILFSNDPSIHVYSKAEYITALYSKSAVSSKLLICFVCIGILPIINEIIFRAGLYRALKSKMSRNTAILLCGLAYAIFLHNLSSFPENIAIGVTLCVLYERTGNIKAPYFLNTLVAIKTCVIAFLLS